MKRNTFLKMGAIAILTPIANKIIEQPFFNNLHGTDTFLMKRLLIANDIEVERLLQNNNELKFSRQLGDDFSIFAASYCSSSSEYFHSPLIEEKLVDLITVLKSFQNEDGTVNIGNLESPPDTAFLVELLTAGALLLSNENYKDLTDINLELEKFLKKAGNALTTGGLHTPNHRWVISAALARLNSLYPDEKYLRRIKEWLQEGVYMDEDGHYPERSFIYSGVENSAFITLGRLLNQPNFYVPVRKNLDMMFYYMEPNGDMVAVDSRRQDQYMQRSVFSFYIYFRYFAIKDNNRHLAGIAHFIEKLPGFESEVIKTSYFHFLENPILQKEMPPCSLLSEEYKKFFTTSQLLRIRKDKMTTTLFGGVDWPIIIASGRSNSPNFFSYRKGKAILKYARLSSGFFSMGYFYSEGIRKENDKYILHKKLEVPYYQPLPKELQNKAGDYELSPSIDGRFWNKMDFKNRPISNVKTLETIVSFIEQNGEVELDFSVSGLEGVSVTIELCFPEVGTFSNTTLKEDGSRFLTKGFGKYEFGGDEIQFGPGTFDGNTITGLEGERYSTHFGNLKTGGQHVYVTGITPFKHTLKFN